MISTSGAAQSRGANRDEKQQSSRRIGMFPGVGSAFLAIGMTAFFPRLGMRAVAAVQAASPAARQIGTVKAVNANTLTLAGDAGQTYTVTVVESARVLQLAPGSTDLKSAQVIALTDIAV